MCWLRLCLFMLCVVGIVSSELSSLCALPLESDLFGAIRTSRKYINPKAHYTLDELEECFTDSLAILAKSWNRLPAVYQREFQGVFLRPGEHGSAYASIHLSKKFDTPHFRFHYTTNGIHATPLEDVSPMNGIPDYVDICAEAMERSFHVQVGLMGFKQPLDDFWAKENGGNRKYDVYLFMFPALGFTTADWYGGRVLSTVATLGPYFAINSRLYDFFGKSEGVRFIQTTSAHEFLHGIQGAYNWFMPAWFMEASATWIESKVYDGGRVEDFDAIHDPDEIGETDAYNYYSHQLRRWFLNPDISLDSRVLDHEYGSAIWVFYMTERFGVDIVRQFYQDTTEGNFREFGNFSQVFINQGTNIVEAFKTFTVWNYFTNDRDDGEHYFNGHRFPPVAVHASDIHKSYPVRVEFDSESMPEHFSARYVVFEPPTSRIDEFSVKIDGADLAPIDMSALVQDDRSAIQVELDRHTLTGLRGWGAKFVIERQDGTTEIREAFTYHRSQEAQVTFRGFGVEIQKITLVLINLRPDVEDVVVPGGSYFGGSVTYVAGQSPSGRLSIPILSQGPNGVRIQWEVEDSSEIHEVVIVRKRYTSLIETDEDRPFQTFAEVRGAADRDRNGIPDGDINIVGRVNATDVGFEDPTIFQDIDLSSPFFELENTRYYYAIVPVSVSGIMGTPSIAPNGISPATNQAELAPAFFIETQTGDMGEWLVQVLVTRDLAERPQLVVTFPDGSDRALFLRHESDTKWTAKLMLNGFPPIGTYTYRIDGQTESDWMGTRIFKGRTFQYAPRSTKRKIIIAPNPISASDGNHLNFYPKGLQVSIFDARGALIKETATSSKWDCTNQYGERVRSGIYFFHAEDGKGFHDQGKICVIR